jgi:hypothetical protein
MNFFYRSMTPKALAKVIRDCEDDEYDLEKLEALCDMAGLSPEWDAADDDCKENVAEAAAEKLGVAIS